MIYFYNTFHNGDIHYSKSFVRDTMKKMGTNDYCYLHNNNPEILKDFPTIKQDKSFTTFDNWNLVSRYPISYYNQVILESAPNNNNIYINTWVGQQNWITKSGMNRNRDDRYCSLYSHYELYEDIFSTLGLPIEPIEYYLPEIDFDFIEKENIDNFFSNNKFDLSVLIVNNDPDTIRIQMDMEGIVDMLSNKYPNILFILTRKANLNRENIAYTNDIIGLACDLNEISYLSKFCDIIVGRPSGPYTFSIIKDNFVKEKCLITISNNKYDQFYFESDADIFLLTNHTSNALINVLENKINERL